MITAQEKNGHASFAQVIGLFLRKQEDNKLSWEETYKAMSEEQEDWSDLNVTVADGLEEERSDIPGAARR